MSSSPASAERRAAQGGPCVGKGILDFAEAQATVREARAKYKQPVVLSGFAAQMPRAAEKQAGGDLNFCLLLFQDKSKMPLRHRADEVSEPAQINLQNAETVHYLARGMPK